MRKYAKLKSPQVAQYKAVILKNSNRAFKVGGIFMLSFLFFINIVNAQELIEIKSDQFLELSADYNKILDYQDLNYCTEKDEFGNCTKITPSVQYLYSTNDQVQQEPNEIIEKRTINTKFFKNGQFKVYSGQPFIELAGTWYKTDIKTVDFQTWDDVQAEKLIESQTISAIIKKNNPFKIYSVNAQATIYDLVGDGQVTATVSSNWDTTHDSTTGQNNSYTNAQEYFTIGWFPNYYLRRLFLPFDTSSLPDDIDIDTAKLNIVRYAGGTPAQDFAVVETNQASVSSLTNADIDNCGDSIDNPTEGSDRYNTGDMTDNVYFEIELNETGKSWIDPTGYTKLGLRYADDMDDIAPSGYALHTKIYTYENTGTTYDPYLLISTSTPEVATTSADLYPCEIPENATIQRIAGCMNIYKTSTTTPDEVRYFYYEIPLINYIFVFSIIAISMVVVILYIYINKKK